MDPSEGSVVRFRCAHCPRRFAVITFGRPEGSGGSRAGGLVAGFCQVVESGSLPKGFKVNGDHPRAASASFRETYIRAPDGLPLVR